MKLRHHESGARAGPEKKCCAPKNTVFFRVEGQVKTLSGSPGSPAQKRLGVVTSRTSWTRKTSKTERDTVLKLQLSSGLHPCFRTCPRILEYLTQPKHSKSRPDRFTYLQKCRNAGKARCCRALQVRKSGLSRRTARGGSSKSYVEGQKAT